MSYFGIGVYHPKTEMNIGTLWRSAQCFGASFVYTVGRRYKTQTSDTLKTSCNVPLYHYADIDELIEGLPVGCPLVGVELTADAERLGGATHPHVACYLLGAEDHGIPLRVLEMCHKVLKVGWASHCLNVAVAGSIVMYDRRINEPKTS